MNITPTVNPTQPRRKTAILIALVAALSISAPRARAQSQQTAHAPDALRQLNDSIEALVRRVSPSVVQIAVLGYGATQESGEAQTSLVIGRRRAIGSGVIVDPEGYIVTNAHVVKGAERIDVVVGAADPNDGTLHSTLVSRARSYPARVVGTASMLDLAVIKIEAHQLPALPISKVMLPKQGEVVFAFGSPEGLRNSVTMGVVSAPARQPDPDSPLVYVQTDTPINPGNSGGPLVNADGELVGINTFILTTSGGNQGLGFAIPAGVVAYAYPQLVKYGHIHQPEIGAILQTINPELAAGLRLPRDFGVIVSDVVPGGPADRAGLRPQDIITSVDGVPTESLPLFTHSLYMHGAGEHAKFEVLRGSDRVQLDVSPVEKPHRADTLTDVVDPIKNRVARLGILGIEINVDLARTLPELRIPSGVIVAAKTLGERAAEVPLETGDVIHSLNGATITSLADLRNGMDKVSGGDAVVLWIERSSQLIYVSVVF